MRSYMVGLTIGDFRTYSVTGATSVKELWYTGLHLMRLMKHNGVKGRFLVRDVETRRTIFWLYTKCYDLEYKIRLGNVGYGKSCGGYTF